MIIFILACIGMTNIIVDGAIFDKPRNFLKGLPFFGKLVTCHQCAGFWCGGLCYLMLNEFTWDIPMTLISACAGSYLANLNILVMDFIISKTEFAVNDE